MPEQAEYMALAVQLARRGWNSTPPNPRVGCVLVRDEQIIGQGWHARAGAPHAEIRALRDAARSGHDTNGCTAYVTLEPCCHTGRTPPCATALIEAGVARVVVGMIDPNPAIAGGGCEMLRAASIDVTTGLLEDDCRALNPGFVCRMQTGRPRVTVKLAMTLDGRTAAPDGTSQWITGDAARTDVHQQRAGAGAIVTGIETALADDPSLTVRLDGDYRQPLRVVLDSHLRMPPTARMLSLPGDTLILTTSGLETRRDALKAVGAEVVRLPAGQGGIDLLAVLAHLATRDINDVWVEAGATLAGALLAQGLVDELVLYIAPSLLGDGARGLFHLPGVQSIADRIDLQIADSRRVGDDWRIRATTRG